MENKYQIQYHAEEINGWVNQIGAEFPYEKFDSLEVRQKALSELNYLRKRYTEVGDKRDFRLVIISTEVLEWA